MRRRDGFFRPSRSAWQRITCVLFVLSGVAGAACYGPTNPKPDLNVATDTLTAWSMVGTLVTHPAGYELATNGAVLVDNTLLFDVAFIVDSLHQQVLVYPVRLLIDPIIVTRHVGLQRLTQNFDSVDYALKLGYQFDSVYALSPGQGLMIVSNPAGCLALPNPSLYGKFVIDSINTSLKTLYFRATVDPNCGFRSFAPGLPTF
jgi:hypothetical protein